MKPSARAILGVWVLVIGGSIAFWVGVGYVIVHVIQMFR